MLGFIIGMAISATVCFFIVQNTQKNSYDRGYESGLSKGISEGVIQARDEQKLHDDSVQVATQRKIELSKKTEKQVVKPEPVRYDINYKMNGNEVGEEVK